MRRCLLLVVTVSILAGISPAQKIRNGEDLLRAMHDRYSQTWYRTLTFTQKSTTYNPDGTSKVETWYESLMLPAKLRIDFGPPPDGNGALLVDENVSIFRKGKLSARQFWIEKDRLLFLRVIQPAVQDEKNLQDIRFGDYRPLAGGWLAAYVEVVSNGKKVFTEEYSDIQANPKLDPALFDPEQFAAKRPQ